MPVSRAAERSAPLRFHWRELFVATVIVSFGLVAPASPSAPPRSRSSVLVVGYYVHDDPNAWTTVLRYGTYLDWIITTNFNITDTQGTLRGDHDSAVMALARRLGTEVHFRVANLAEGNFSREIAHAILTDRTARARAVAGIVRILDTYGYDGVNVDLEDVAAADRAALTSFVTELHTAARSRGKTVSIAVPALTPGELADSAFDLARLSQLLDWIIVMAYDEHWEGSPPGPVASFPWVETVMRSTMTQVPTKLLLGLAYYGYAWPTQGQAQSISLSMREATRRAEQAGVPVLWDGPAKVPYYRTTDRIVYFENRDSVAQKLILARQLGVSGVAIWRLGHELPDVWEPVKAYRAGQPAP